MDELLLEENCFADHKYPAAMYFERDGLIATVYLKFQHNVVLQDQHLQLLHPTISYNTITSIVL